MSATAQTSQKLTAFITKEGICAGEFSPDSGQEPFESLAAAKARGFLYVAIGYARNATPYFKVGFSRNPLSRVKQLSRDSIFANCELIAATPARMLDEFAVLEFLKASKFSGEWHNPSRRLERLIYYITAHECLPPELLRFANSCAEATLAKRKSQSAMAELSAAFSGREGCSQQWPRLSYGPNSGPDRNSPEWALLAAKAGRTKAARENAQETTSADATDSVGLN